jgi:hypothetical protein
MPASKRRPPKGVRWVEQVFFAKNLTEPDGIVFRKVTSVEIHASETLLLTIAKSRGFFVTRHGTHYVIHRPGVMPVALV